MKKILFLCAFFAFNMSKLAAQTTTLSGKIVKKEWSKSLDSYCAGGSDYYVLVQANKQEAILDLSKWSATKIKKYLNKTVKLNGSWKMEQKENNDPHTQHPVDAPMCTIFKVE